MLTSPRTAAAGKPECTERQSVRRRCNGQIRQATNNASSQQTLTYTLSSPVPAISKGVERSLFSMLRSTMSASWGEREKTIQ